MPSVLVVEDEIRIARLVKDYLHEAGFAVLTARTGKAGLALVRSEKPDLVILDIGLPEMDGYDVTRSMRATSTTPIIMLTARNAETDRIVGLELGADDYVVKPFSPRELVARVKAVLRRTSGGMPVEVIRARDLVIDLSRRTVSRDGTTIDLTTSEFELLRFMATQPGRVFTRGQLLDLTRGEVIDGQERSIDAHIKNMRRKLEPGPGRPRYITTVYGVGYRFEDA